MSETIEAKELRLVDIFSDDYRFEIPEYQRPYAWTTDQTGDLLDDLLHAVGDVENVSDASPYFLGSIVIIKSVEQIAKERNLEMSTIAGHLDRLIEDRNGH